MRVMYHGSIVRCHGMEGTLEYDYGRKWHYIVLDSGEILMRVHRESFTILEEGLTNTD